MDTKKVAYLAWLGVNYGSTLQAYALNKSIEKLGYLCEVIGGDGFIDGQEPDPSLKDADPKKYDWQLTKYNFNQFMYKHFVFNKELGTIPGNSMLTLNQLQETEKYAAFVCGSDQIWKPGSFWFSSKQYLHFAPTFKRVSYAPSVGWKRIPESSMQNVEQWKKWLSGVPYLSTREETGTALVQELTGRHTETVVDPTMLLTPAEWVEQMNEPVYSAEIKKIIDSGKKYLLAYFLDHADIFRKKVAALAAKLGLEIIWLTGRDNVGPLQINITETDPAGFVNLINKADFVCVDGFHGTCFSLNFGKPVAFFTIHRDFDKANDTRVPDLFSRMGLDPDRHIVNPDTRVDDIALSYDFKLAGEAVSRAREKSAKYLKDALLGASENKGALYDMVQQNRKLIIDNYAAFVNAVKKKSVIDEHAKKMITDSSYKFNAEIWEMQTADDSKILVPKLSENDRGRFAYYLLPEEITNQSKCFVKFQIYVHSSQIVNIHFANSKTGKFVIAHRLRPDSDSWQELILEFSQSDAQFDAIMVGAKQISGDDRGFGIRNVSITENFITAETAGIQTIKTHSVMTVVRKSSCSGCGACAMLCPKKAITMAENDEGFLTSQVDLEKCTDCGQCLKKCISEHPYYKNAEKPECYAVMASDDIRKVSSSGGFFTVAANYVLSQQGYVCGAAYDDNFRVHHIIISDPKDLPRLRGSKYMQSNLGTVFKDIRDLLKQKALVLFTGMPCQVAGLLSYLNRDYDNLITVDLLCHGISSSKVFEKYHKDVLEGKPLKRLEFKEKEPWGWHAGINAYFEDGTKYSHPLEEDMYYAAYLKSLSKNTVCSACASNHLPRQGDVSIGDFWGISTADPSMFDPRLGTSVVLVNNRKGKSFFEKIRTDFAKTKKERLSDAIKINKIINDSYSLHKNRDLFFRLYDKCDFSSVVKGCLNNNCQDVEKKHLLTFCQENEVEFFYLAKHVAQKANGRKIVTYGKSREFNNLLNKFFGLSVAFTLTDDDEKADDVKSFLPKAVYHKSAEFFVVSVIAGYKAEFALRLEKTGYRDLEDFIFRVHKPIILNELDLSQKRYEDAYGNTIEGWSGVIPSVVLRGCNTHVVIGKSVSKAENLSFDLGSNSYISFGEGCRINSDVKVTVFGASGSSEVVFGNDCRLTSGEVRIFNHPARTSIRVGNNTTFETNLELHANVGKKLIIGNDCMISHFVEMWAGDGHTVFDVNTGKNINSNYDGLPEHKNQLVLGDHVWVGKEAYIMHGTNIAAGSIVGARSVVKGRFPNNCVVAGNPARCVKKDVAWSRDMIGTNMKRDCGDISYVAKTKENAVPQSQPRRRLVKKLTKGLKKIALFRK